MSHLLLGIALIFVLPGPGTEIQHDIGYWTEPEGQPTRKWVSIIRTLELVGVESSEFPVKDKHDRPLLCFVEKGKPLAGDSHALSREEFAKAKVMKLAAGVLPTVDVSDVEVPLRKER
jgi:hypothetical protein